MRPDIVMPFLLLHHRGRGSLSGGNGQVIFSQGTPTSGFLDDRFRLAARGGAGYCARHARVLPPCRRGGRDVARRRRRPGDALRRATRKMAVHAIRWTSIQLLRAAARPSDRGDGPLIVAAGRLAGVKNYPLLIGGVADWARAWILGDGPNASAAAIRGSARHGLAHPLLDSRPT